MTINTARLTCDQADAIFRASRYFDLLDDVDTDPRDDGFLYFLVDGSLVLVRHDGSLTHSKD